MKNSWWIREVVDRRRILNFLLCVQLKDSGEREGGRERKKERQARKFATTSCHGQPASFASRSYHSVHDSTVVVGVRPYRGGEGSALSAEAERPSIDRRRRFSS